MRICTAIRPKDFIVSIAQQISWLAAACYEKPDKLSCAYVGFSEAELRPHDVVFKVDVKLFPATSRDTKSCWNTLLGPAVVISGFPVPLRNHGEYGLETSVSAMAAMAGTPLAVSFEGGFIFKGRCHALVPVQANRSQESVQWHMVDTYPDKLPLDHIRTQFSTRSKGHINSYAKYRCFVGWYPVALDLMGKSPTSVIPTIPSLMFSVLYLVLS